MKVRAGSVYIYHPNLLDKIDGRTNLKAGDAVKVVNLPGCPRANVMGHCHVADPKTGHFIGLVHVNSLHTRADYLAYLKQELAKLENNNANQL